MKIHSGCSTCGQEFVSSGANPDTGDNFGNSVSYVRLGDTHNLIATGTKQLTTGLREGKAWVLGLGPAGEVTSVYDLTAELYDEVEVPGVRRGWHPLVSKVSKTPSLPRRWANFSFL